MKPECLLVEGQTTEGIVSVVGWMNHKRGIVSVAGEEDSGGRMSVGGRILPQLQKIYSRGIDSVAGRRQQEKGARLGLERGANWCGSLSLYVQRSSYPTFS